MSRPLSEGKTSGVPVMTPSRIHRRALVLAASLMLAPWAAAQPPANPPSAPPAGGDQAPVDLARPRFRSDAVTQLMGADMQAAGRMTSTPTGAEAAQFRSSGPTAVQYGGGGGGGWWGGGWGYQPATGAALNGFANIISSEGQFRVANQQSRLIGQQVKQAQLETKRKSLEEWLYERDILPTRQDEIERDQYQQLRRSRNNPLPSEIWTGRALNDLFQSINKMHRTGVPGPNVPIQPWVLQNINFTSGTTARGAGVFKQGSDLQWPGAFDDAGFEPLRKQADGLVQKLVAEAATGRVNGATLRQFNQTLNDMEGEVRARVSDMTPTDNIQARRYLRELRESAQVFNQRDLERYFGQAARIQAGNVAELVDRMNAQGVRFAPAVSGDEEAYNSLWNSLASFEIAMSQGGTRLMAGGQ